jgi:glycine cleavage system H lipoate-binding protein
MQGIEHSDLFATKGLEYLISAGFLLLLIVFWKFLAGPAARAAEAVREAVRAGWFAIRDGYLFHQGHTWAATEQGRTVRVGLDDFAGQLIGTPSGFDLPRVGQRIRQGDLGWTVRVGDRSIRMLSPVDGVVEAVNPEISAEPGLATSDPYEQGWLLRVRVRDPGRLHRNLMSSDLAGRWLDQAGEEVRTMWTRELGVVLPDGGALVHGFGRELASDRWDQLAEELLHSADLDT